MQPWVGQELQEGFLFFSKKKKAQPFSPPGLLAGFPVPLVNTTVARCKSRPRQGCGHHPTTGKGCSDANLERGLNTETKGLASTDSPSTAPERTTDVIQDTLCTALELQRSFTQTLNSFPVPTPVLGAQDQRMSQTWSLSSGCL